MLAHFEYQRENDERMGERLLAYNVLASDLNDYLPVLTCVIYLKRAKNAPRSPFVKKLRSGRVTTIFYYASIDLGEITVEELLAKGLPGLLPLLPLTNGVNQHDAIDIMIEELTEAGKTDILWIGYVLAAKVFSSASDLQWLKGRFAILNDFLWDSPIYQEIITDVEIRAEARGEARGVETGKMQALSQTRVELGQGLLSLVATRFPELNELAQVRVNKINDTTTLTHLIVQIGMAQTEQEAKKILTSS